MHEGDLVDFGAAKARVIDTPGHTLGHVAYYFADGGLLFPGDTLFSLGCGRLFEGTPEDMFSALRKFAELPDDTLVCSPPSTDGTAGQPTVPSVLGGERAANPFLRAPDAATLGRLRAEKDKFK